MIFPVYGCSRPGNDPQNCRLAATRSAEQHQRLAFGNVKVDVFEHAVLPKRLLIPVTLAAGWGALMFGAEFTISFMILAGCACTILP